MTIYDVCFLCYGNLKRIPKQEADTFAAHNPTESKLSHFDLDMQHNPTELKGQEGLRAGDRRFGTPSRT